MYMYYYDITIYLSDTRSEETESGYVCGDSYTSALDRLLEYFGEDETVDVKLSFVTDKPILVLPTQKAIKDKGLVAAIRDNNDI